MMRFGAVFFIAAIWGHASSALQVWEPSSELRHAIEVSQAEKNLGPSLCFNPFNPFADKYVQEGNFDLEADAEVLRSAGANIVLFERGPCVSQIVAKGPGFEFARGYSTIDGSANGYQAFVTFDGFEGELPNFE